MHNNTSQLFFSCGKISCTLKPLDESMQIALCTRPFLLLQKNIGLQQVGRNICSSIWLSSQDLQFRISRTFLFVIQKCFDFLHAKKDFE